MTPLHVPGTLAIRPSEPRASRHASTWATLVLILLPLLQGAPARAETPLGVEFGKSKFTSSIDLRSGETDEDVFAAPLLAGERLTVTLAIPKKGTLQPVLSLVQPDGTLITGDALGVKANKKRTKLKLSKFDVLTTGIWGVRVTGAGVTTGTYTISTKISKARKTKLKDQDLDAAGPGTRDHVFGGTDGALFSFKLTWSKKQSPVRADALEDPQSDAVPGAAAAVQAKGANKLLLKKAPLSTGVGSYVLRTAVDAGTANYAISYSVTPQDRPKSGKKPEEVSSTEPILAIRADPLVGIEGSRLRVTGSNFSTSGAPSVFFGDTPGTGVSVGGGGAFLDVDVPAGTDGTVVSLAVQNPDGQASRRGAYFLYPPPPVIADLRDVTDAVRRGGSTAGGQSFRLLGANFAAPVTVRFGLNSAAVTALAGDGSSATVTTPAGAIGDAAIVLTDAFGRDAVAPFMFTYKVPPAFAATPFDPLFAAVVGGTTVTLSGTGFEIDDALSFAGVGVTLANVNSTTATFSSPALPAGLYTSQLVDRVGTIVFGPIFVIEAPPTIRSVAAISGPFAAPDEVPLAGGTTMRATGTGFRATNTFEFDGSPLTVSNVTATSFDFAAPSSTTFGGKPLLVTDIAGQQGALSDAVKYVGFSDANHHARAGGLFGGRLQRVLRCSRRPRRRRRRERPRDRFVRRLRLPARDADRTDAPAPRKRNDAAGQDRHELPGRVRRSRQCGSVDRRRPRDRRSGRLQWSGDRIRGFRLRPELRRVLR